MQCQTLHMVIYHQGIATIRASGVGVSYASSLYNNAEFTLTLTGQAKYTALDKSTNRANWLNDETWASLNRHQPNQHVFQTIVLVHTTLQYSQSQKHRLIIIPPESGKRIYGHKRRLAVLK